jgi:hypothetical protein
MNRRMSLRRLLGLVLLVVLTPLGVLEFETPFSPCGWCEFVALIAIATWLLLPVGRTRRGIGLLALVLLVGVPIVRLGTAGSERATIITLPGGDTRWLTRLVDEQDVSLIGARILKRLWRPQGAERDGLLPAISEAYAEMRKDLGTTASPVVDTLLGRQHTGGFDTIVIEPSGNALAAVIFLHGFAGSATQECWLVARAAREIDAVTVCPATGFSGRWSDPEGEKTLRATLAYVSKRGLTRVFLAGLSNGGIGAATLAPKFASHLRGLILIFGSPWSGTDSGLPTLIVQGEQDPMASATAARAFAAQVHATYAGFDGGHFVLLMRRQETSEVIARWLRTHA